MLWTTKSQIILRSNVLCHQFYLPKGPFISDVGKFLRFLTPFSTLLGSKCFLFRFLWCIQQSQEYKNTVAQKLHIVQILAPVHIYQPVQTAVLSRNAQIIVLAGLDQVKFSDFQSWPDLRFLCNFWATVFCMRNFNGLEL